MNQPERGEVWLIDLGMAAKVRPCLVRSIPSNDSDRALVSFISHTTTLRNSTYEVRAEARFLKEGAFNVQSIATLPRAKFIRKMGVLRADQMRNIDTALCRWLGIDHEPLSFEKSNP